MDADGEQRLGAVHVADTAHDRLVEQQRPDRGAATSDAVESEIAISVTPERIRSEATHDRVAVLGSADRACGGAGEIDSDVGRGESHANLSDRCREPAVVGGAVNTEPAEQTEMNMADLAGRPPVEEVLAIGLDAFEHRPVDTGGVGGEAALRGRHVETLTHQQGSVILRDAVDGVALGHGRSVGPVGRGSPVRRH